MREVDAPSARHRRDGADLTALTLLLAARGQGADVELWRGQRARSEGWRTDSERAGVCVFMAFAIGAHPLRGGTDGATRHVGVAVCGDHVYCSRAVESPFSRYRRRRVSAAHYMDNI